jgi:exopolysaccharide biosynthesis polyprenyl glycosylphosphotransferase
MRAQCDRRWVTVVELISTLLAYFASYGLVSKLELSLIVGDSGEPLVGLQGWLLLGLALMWALLLAGWMPMVSTSKRGMPSVWQALGMEAIFLAILSSLYLAKLVPLGLFTFFLLGSVLYLLVSWLLRCVVMSLMLPARLILHDCRILVIGSKCRAREVIRAIKNSKENCEVVGCLDPDVSLAGRNVEDITILGPIEMLPQYLFAHAVDLVVFALPLGLVSNAKAMIDAAIDVGIPVAVVPDFFVQGIGYELGGRDDFLESLLGARAAILSNVPHNTTYLVLKRLLDVIISGFLLVLLLPLFLVIAILVKLTSSRGPVFYSWKVLGRNRRPFVGYKFRTMVLNADELKKELLQHNEMQGPVFKMRNDPRVTPFGRFLRKYSLDELPQLYSVLKGDMSLVGPRPPGREEADQFQFWQRRKLSITPGITCLWQVNGRSDIKSFDEWARLDLQYISNASLWLDFMILLKTVPAVIRGRGAQ